MKPTHTHDCKHCKLLGTINSVDNPGHVADLYHCRNPFPNIRGEGSVIARYSSDGPDYASSPTALVSNYLNDLIAAKALAGFA